MSEKYSMVRLLGEGSFGKCYLVEASSDHSLCVIKQIDIRTMTPSEKDETVKEALILRSLEHPNIIHFRDAYTTKRGKLCIVMDFADGGDLQSRIQNQKGKYFPEYVILDWFVQICLAIKHIHDRKILHRDLKSQNIFITANGRVKLGDFGIAKVLSKTTDNAKTMVGTPYYLSPEIIENRPYSFKSDVWSLGVLLYEMCSLKPPFDASSLHFLALKIVRGVYPALPAQYSRDLKALTAKMLATDPQRRPSVHQILKEPIIRNRIQNFLSSSRRAEEFSHTILHNHDIFNYRPPAEEAKDQQQQEEAQEIKPAMSKSNPKPDKRYEQSEENKNEPEQQPAMKEAKTPKLKPAWSEESKSPALQETKPKKKRSTKKQEEPPPEPEHADKEAERKSMIDDIRRRKKELKNQSQEFQFVGAEEKEQREEDAMLYEMGEAMLAQESDAQEEPTMATESEVVPPDREDEIAVDEENQPSQPLPEVGSAYNKIEALRLYLEEKLGDEVLVEAYRIIKECNANEDEIGYDKYYPYLKHLMNRETQLEYLPIIQALIDMESY